MSSTQKAFMIVLKAVSIRTYHVLLFRLWTERDPLIPAVQLESLTRVFR